MSIFLRKESLDVTDVKAFFVCLFCCLLFSQFCLQNAEQKHTLEGLFIGSTVCHFWTYNWFRMLSFRGDGTNEAQYVNF